MVKDKGLQKLFYQAQQIPTAPFRLTEDIRLEDPASLHFPFVLKSRTGGYDGKGVQIIKRQEQLAEALPGPCVIEELVDFTKELAILVSRNSNGQISTFPLVEMEFNPDANLVEFLQFQPTSNNMLRRLRSVS